MFLHKLMFWKKAKKRSYPNLGDTLKTSEMIAVEMNAARGRQMEAERQKRPDIAIVQKARYEALLWVLGKEHATATVR